MVRMSRLAHGAPSMVLCRSDRLTIPLLIQMIRRERAWRGLPRFQGHHMLRPWPGLPALTRSWMAHQVSRLMTRPQIQLRTDSIAGYFISGNVTHGWNGDPVKPPASCRRPRPTRHREGSPRKSGCGMHEKLGPGDQSVDR
jgi:hypothetical protein